MSRSPQSADGPARPQQGRRAGGCSPGGRRHRQRRAGPGPRRPASRRGGDAAGQSARDAPTVGLPVVERGTEIEIKSCLREHPTQRGRFSFRRDQHGVLLDRAAVYLLVVTTEGPGGREVLARKLVPATTVDEALSSDSWVDPGAGRTDHYQRRSWSQFFDPEEVDG